MQNLPTITQLLRENYILLFLFGLELLLFRVYVQVEQKELTNQTGILQILLLLLMFFILPPLMSYTI